MAEDKIIGVVGGVGPYAGLDLCRKIMDQTKSNSDQEHLSIVLLSMPTQIEDRTRFLLKKTGVNPGLAISNIIKKLEKAGAEVIGIPCNSVHVPEIFNVIVEDLRRTQVKVKLLNMIAEIALFIEENYSPIKRIGILSTTGTYKSDIFRKVLEGKGYQVILPNEVWQEEVVHRSVYDPGYGIKAHSMPVNSLARQQLIDSIYHLEEKGAEAVVLGCTEISLAISDMRIGNVEVIDSTMVLARALIREAAPHKLKDINTFFTQIKEEEILKIVDRIAY